MATVIERFGTSIEGGIITHDDRPSTYKAAEKIAGHKLDRRKSYAIINGQVAESYVWSQACSGCYECGYWTASIWTVGANRTPRVGD